MGHGQHGGGSPALETCARRAAAAAAARAAPVHTRPPPPLPLPTTPASRVPRARVPLWTAALASLVSFGRARRAPGVISCAYKPSRPFRIFTSSEDFSTMFFAGPPFKLDHTNKVHTNYANCVRFSPDGAHAASVGSDKKVVIYDGKTGAVEKELVDPAKAQNHQSSITSCAWSPDGARLATCSSDKTVKLCDFFARARARKGGGGGGGGGGGSARARARSGQARRGAALAGGTPARRGRGDVRDGRAIGAMQAAVAWSGEFLLALAERRPQLPRPGGGRGRAPPARAVSAPTAPVSCLCVLPGDAPTVFVGCNDGAVFALREGVYAGPREPPRARRSAAKRQGKGTSAAVGAGGATLVTGARRRVGRAARRRRRRQTSGRGLDREAAARARVLGELDLVAVVTPGAVRPHRGGAGRAA